MHVSKPNTTLQLGAMGAMLVAAYISTGAGVQAAQHAGIQELAEGLDNACPGGLRDFIRTAFAGFSDELQKEQKDTAALKAEVMALKLALKSKFTDKNLAQPETEKNENGMDANVSRKERKERRRFTALQPKVNALAADVGLLKSDGAAKSERLDRYEAEATLFAKMREEFDDLKSRVDELEGHGGRRRNQQSTSAQRGIEAVESMLGACCGGGAQGRAWESATGFCRLVAAILCPLHVRVNVRVGSSRFLRTAKRNQ